MPAFQTQEEKQAAEMEEYVAMKEELARERKGRFPWKPVAIGGGILALLLFLFGRGKGAGKGAGTGKEMKLDDEDLHFILASKETNGTHTPVLVLTGTESNPDGFKPQAFTPTDAVRRIFGGGRRTVGVQVRGDTFEGDVRAVRDLFTKVGISFHGGLEQ